MSIAPKTGQSGVGGILALVGHGDDVVELLVLHLQPAGHGAVNDRLELGIDGVP